MAIDRGGSYHTATYKKYAKAVAGKRVKGYKGMRIILDKNANVPIIIEIVALDGNGISTQDENDKSLVATVHFGQFDIVMGGDLSGYDQSQYKDIESTVAQDVGRVEVYKVNHHGSRHSSNLYWLRVIQPIVGIISVGDNKDHGHPTQACMKRLHDIDVKTYWTEPGTGTKPNWQYDKICGNTIVEVEPGSDKFAVSCNGGTPDTYTIWPDAAFVPELEEGPVEYAWSVKSNVYHYAECKYVHNINLNNLRHGDVPPDSKVLHDKCPVK
jgi:hypothetical protein